MPQRIAEKNQSPDVELGFSAMLADDDVDFALAAADVLRGSGFNVEFVADGARALERALGSTPDVVLLDQRMPRMTGGDVFTALVAAGFRAPIVLMTASEDITALQEMTGARYLLGKPFDAEELLRTLRQALAGRDAG